jgi:hypothetical protein
MRIHRLWLLVLACAMALAFGPPPVSVAVHPRISMGRQDVRVTATVERSDANRLLVLAIDGTEYMRQDVQMNTDDHYEDPRVMARWFKAVPPGEYAVTADVLRADGSSKRATASFCLAGVEISCQ